MTGSLFLQLIMASMLGALLRDVQVWGAAKVFCWRKRRQTQREAQQNRELRQLAAEFAAHERSEEESRKQIAKRVAEACKVPFPRLMGGPLIITANTRDEVYMYCRQISSNIASKQEVNCFSESSFEEN
jgi:hypothetical protein